MFEWKTGLDLSMGEMVQKSKPRTEQYQELLLKKNVYVSEVLLVMQRLIFCVTR